MFKIILFAVAFYIIYKIVRLIGRLVAVSSQLNKMQNSQVNKNKTYSKEDIEEAEYEEIK